MNRKQILFLSSYPPRECGIATYTKDLLSVLQDQFGQSYDFTVCALQEAGAHRTYPGEVVATLNVHCPDDFHELAEGINNNEAIAAVFIQHEFGLFGGDYGDHLLYLLYSLNKPVLLTFHTVLPQPDDKRKSLVKAISQVTEKITVMTHRSKEILVKDYDLEPDDIEVIPHGTHSVLWQDKQTMKQQCGLDNQLVLSTFGLISPNKGIELALDALPAIKEQFPEVLYLVLGRTHPCVVKHDGESYRSFLLEKVHELGIEANVTFVNRYLPLQELLKFLHLTDVYLFTSKDPNQAVSGTFSYAMSSACPIIATGIPHAQEMLDNSKGITIDFDRPDQLSEAAIKLLSDGQLREIMGRNAFRHTRTTTWENTAIRYGQLISEVSGEEAVLTYTKPRFCLDHLKRLTDDFGVIQFSDINRPDITSGYTLDDNARALIATCRHYYLTQDPADTDLMERYLNFIEHCQLADGQFMNYVDADRAYHIENGNVNLDDSNGRAIWALGYLIAHSYRIPADLVFRAEAILVKTLPKVETIHSPRSISFIIKGLYYYNRLACDPKIIFLIDRLADRLITLYDNASAMDWQWFEEYLTYANSTLPEAALLAFRATEKVVYKVVAKTTFDFLLSHLFHNGQIKVISNNGWFHKQRPANRFGEQPIDVAYTIEALDQFYNVFHEQRYQELMDVAFSWFLGNNHLRQTIYDHVSGGCYDGLEQHNVNLNQGAESTICYLMARMIMEKDRVEPLSGSIDRIRKEEKRRSRFGNGTQLGRNVPK